jgi:alkaline phosphatase D
MTTLSAPGLGPIVGDTTDTTCRIWIRAAHAQDTDVAHDDSGRTVGILGMVNAGNTIGDAWYFRLHREYDRTGSFKVGSDVQLGLDASDIAMERTARPGAAVPNAQVAAPLTPNTPYVARIATFTLNDPAMNTEILPDWALRQQLPPIDTIKNGLLNLPADVCEARFRTFPTPAVADKLSFLLGSCRYPGWFGSAEKKGDQIFGPMLAHFTNSAFGDPARFTLMVGDQIYADRDFPGAAPGSYEGYRKRYIDAWSTVNFRRLVRSSTVYMILDDHEIKNDWTMDEKPANEHTYVNATAAYLNFQWSFSPRSDNKKFYYRFECGGYPVFALDTRNARYKNRSGLRDNHLLGFPDAGGTPGQLELLLGWLSEQQQSRGNVPKFIVSSSVFVPNLISQRLDPQANLDPFDNAPPRPLPQGDEAILYEANARARDGSDAWAAYPSTRLAILRHIVTKKIQNVVFLSGDVHLSCVAVMDFEGNTAAKKLKAFAVTSSPLFWNVGASDPNSFVHDSRADGQDDYFPILTTNVAMHYRAFGFCNENNFTRLDVDKQSHTISVRLFNAKGFPLGVSDPKGNPVAVTVLELAPW